MRLRSVLFTPGTRPDRIQKALQSGAADVVVADLEDAVAPKDKIEARIAVRNALLAVRPGTAPSLRAVRINAWPSSLSEEDLEVVLPTAPDLVVVPKAADPMAIQVLDSRIGDAEDEAGLEPGTIGLLLIVETAAGILSARELATCSDRVVGLCLGAEDLAAEVGMVRSPGNEEVSVARSWLALCAAAGGVAAIDMITADVADTDRILREATEARSLGYRGKMCIHPSQAAAVHAALAPTADEVAWAERVVEASQDVRGGGIVVVDGRMIDVPLIEQARRVLDEAGA